MMIKKILIVLILTMNGCLLIAQSKSERVFNLDQKVVFKTKGVGADIMRTRIVDFLKKENVMAGKRAKSAIDTIFITQYSGNRKNIIPSVDIYKHSVQIYYSGDNGRDKAFDLLVSKYDKMAGTKKTARHYFIDNMQYSNSLDLTKSNINIRELHESIDESLENGAKEIYLKIYSGDGLSILSPNYKLFNPKETLSKVEMCYASELYDILKQHTKKVRFILIIDFADDENSYFREVMGYNALSDEGCRVLRPFVEELAPLLEVANIEVLYDDDDLKLKCFIEPLFDTIDPKRAKISIMNSVNDK